MSWSEQAYFLRPAWTGWVAPMLLAFAAGCVNPPGRQSASRQKPADAVTVLDPTYLKIVRTDAGDTVYADSILLHLVEAGGDTVRGTYRWQLPGKDGRRGNITGVRSGDTIDGHYQYTQEGGSYRDSIQVFVGTGQAVVKQYGEDGYTLLDTLATGTP